MLVLVRALYGLMCSGSSWRSTLAAMLESMNFQNTIADPNVWRRRAMKPNGFSYYKLLLVYIDDIMVISHDPKVTLLKIYKVYQLK